MQNQRPSFTMIRGNLHFAEAQEDHNRKMIFLTLKQASISVNWLIFLEYSPLISFCVRINQNIYIKDICNKKKTLSTAAFIMEIIAYISN